MEVPESNRDVSQPAYVEAIEGIAEPVVLNYFNTLNASEFESTVALFAADGSLKPPFEADITGLAAIAAYLEQEAKGMKLLPRQGIVEGLENDQRQVQVSGKVQTSLFTVNVAWTFILNTLDQIVYARIKLLASPKELLNLRQ